MPSHCTRWKVDEEEIRSKSMIQQKRSYCLKFISRQCVKLSCYQIVLPMYVCLCIACIIHQIA